jgi:hypothetical protein
MVKGKVKTLMYSSERDLKNFGLTALGESSIYIDGFQYVARALAINEIEAARARIVRNQRGKFDYIPSDEYIRALSRIRLKNH